MSTLANTDPHKWNLELLDIIILHPSCGEQSIFLNVLTPANAAPDSECLLPVKVWIHGGGNAADSASNPLYNGCYLALDAIVVMINYALDPLGYLALKPAGLFGNYGIQDQLLALQWIQRNIAAFVLSWNLAGEEIYPPYLKSRIVEAWGCDAANIGCIRSLNVTVMNNTLDRNLMVAFYRRQNGPSATRQIGTQVSAIISTNENEGTIFWLSSGVSFAAFNEEMYDTFIDYNFGPCNGSVKARYPVSRCPTYRALKGAVNKNIPAFSYRLNHTPNCAWLPGFPQHRKFLDALGYTHLSELPFVFGIKDRLPPTNGNCSSTPQEVGISDFMVNAWMSMARRQELGPSNVWPAWSMEKSNGVIFGALPSVGYQDYMTCDFWNPITASIFELVQTEVS
ncbi:uncharacterized protein A1O9_12249 [Exophiala aquamarina CBS 119918]|uniref:Carboxylesterase type B domain-containing protein n=1 Tax=Exophiala aquamarina CBS 119918 TaxID=1182545 RepID=A0A072NUQ8_9EURO|nr:uncharacterized protein A1O9_12249 [Exophiala aquamarina CBS 119918]KEF51614.1 hypothetical protein A1O9_12249 [Exophiala aquamarina CBS 119918]